MRKSVDVNLVFLEENVDFISEGAHCLDEAFMLIGSHVYLLDPATVLQVLEKRTNHKGRVRKTITHRNYYRLETFLLYLLRYLQHLLHSHLQTLLYLGLVNLQEGESQQ